MDDWIDKNHQDERQNRIRDNSGRTYIFDSRSRIYKPESPPSREEGETEKPRSKPRWKVRRKWFTLVVPNVIGLATFGIVAAYTYYAAKQVASTETATNVANRAVRESKRTDRANSLDNQRAFNLSREALEQVQRAFVFHAMSMSKGVDARGPVTNVVLAWENSGVTPTRNLTIHVSHKITTSLPPDFDFPELWDDKIPTKERINRPTLIGPKGSVGSESFAIIGPRLEEMFTKGESIYVWGTAKYRDVFPGTKPHITEFCSYLSPLRDSTGMIFLVGVDCAKHNCYDEDCVDYKRQIKRM